MGECDVAFIVGVALRDPFLLFPVAAEEGVFDLAIFEQIEMNGGREGRIELIFFLS